MDRSVSANPLTEGQGGRVIPLCRKGNVCQALLYLQDCCTLFLGCSWKGCWRCRHVTNGLGFPNPLADTPVYGMGSHCCSIWIVPAEREELAGPADAGQGLHSCIPSGRLWQISVLQCSSFQRKLLEKGYGTATQFPLDRKQQFSPTNCRFFLENNPRNESVKGTAQNRLLFHLATAECTCVGLFLSSLYKNDFHNFKSFFQVTQAGFIFQH